MILWIQTSWIKVFRRNVLDNTKSHNHQDMDGDSIFIDVLESNEDKKDGPT